MSSDEQQAPSAIEAFDPGRLPAQPEPEVKDWTWTLHRPCPECGFRPASVHREQLPQLIRAATSGWSRRLAEPDARTRPAERVWSPLEYACHVRDVLRLFAQRATLMLEQDDPRFANWDQDETAVVERYWEQDPAAVAAEIEEATETAAAVFGRPTGGQWQRPGLRSNGSVFTVESLGVYFLHDLVHHAWDVRVDSRA